MLVRIRRLSLGNPGEVKAVGGGVYEMKIELGPGYRLYFTRIGSSVVLLLVGGDKSSQRMDIEKARRLAENL